jgi:ATP-dependent DNA ligase
LLKAFNFCIPTAAKKVFAGPDWLHEIKYDGCRLRVERDGDRVRLVTRGGYDQTKRYPWIVEVAPKNRVRQVGHAIISLLGR